MVYLCGCAVPLSSVVGYFDMRRPTHQFTISILGSPWRSVVTVIGGGGSEVGFNALFLQLAQTFIYLLFTLFYLYLCECGLVFFIFVSFVG